MGTMRYNRIIAKFGTNLLTAGTGKLDLEVMASLVGQVAELHREAREVIVVSSGAMAAGRQKLGVSDEDKEVPLKQVLASVGQSRLMHAYEQLFSWHDITVAQALLTRGDLVDRAGYLNARNTLLALMELKVICIVNENDVVSIDEIEGVRFGDNDNLSAMVANLVDADLLVLLTDIGGLYTADPHHDPKATLIPRVDKIDAEIEALAGGSFTRRGVGGMATKIESAKLATASGVTVVVAPGSEPGVLVRVANGEQIGTWFSPRPEKLESKDRWMLSGLACKGKLVIDAGAVAAIREQNKSLLPAGIVSAENGFQRGDIVDIFDEQGSRIGCGIANYSAADLKAIRGARSDRINSLLGYDYGAEMVHKNNLVLI
jgi:glutamate 5-kinase